MVEIKAHRPDYTAKLWALLKAHPSPMLAVPAAVPGDREVCILSMGVSTAGSEPPGALALDGPARARADAEQGDLSF